MSLQSRCPKCRKVLKLKSKSAFGKQVPCPKCGERFTVKPFKAPEPEPEDEWADDAYDDGYDDDGGYDEDYESPAPKRSAGSKKKGKGAGRKKRGTGAPAWMMGLGIGAGVVAALGLLVALVMFLMGSGGGVNNAMNLAWLPANADIFIQVKPREMWNAPLVAPLRNSELLSAAMDKAMQQQGLPIGAGDIDSVTMAVVGAGDMYEQQQNLFGGMVGQPQIVQPANPQTVGVMRLSKQLTADDLSRLPEAEKRDHAGGDLWITQQQGKEVAFYLADSSTVLFGETALVTAAIERGATEERVERIDFINSDHQLVFAFAPERILPGKDSSLGDSAGDALANTLNQSARGFSFGLSLTSDIELETRVACNASTDAAKIRSDIETALADARSKFDEMGAAPPLGFFDVSTFVEIGREAVDSFKVSSSGDQVTITGLVPGKISTAIKELTDNPMIAAMIEGALNQAGGTPGMPSGIPSGSDMPPGSGGSGYDPGDTAGQAPVANTSPDAAEQANIDAVNQERVETGETLDGIRDKVKDTTGKILTFPGGGQRKLPTGTTGSGGNN